MSVMYVTPLIPANMYSKTTSSLFMKEKDWSNVMYAILAIPATTVAASLIAAASNQKIFSGQLAAASIQERPLIKK